MIGCLPTQTLAFLAVFVYATHATQEIAFEWKPGFLDLHLNNSAGDLSYQCCDIVGDLFDLCDDTQLENN